jgi:hypothetical protein
LQAADVDEIGMGIALTISVPRQNEPSTMFFAVFRAAPDGVDGQ